MVNVDIWYEFKEFKQVVKALKNEIKELSSKVNPADEMWDDQDMIQSWKVSKRTLAAWRSEGKIDYVKLKHKIFYPREAREIFIAKHMVKMKEGVNE